jgi:hypothetical protein
MQNLAAGGSSTPHRGQSHASFPPHSIQNFAADGFSCRHCEQIKATIPFLRAFATTQHSSVFGADSPIKGEDFARTAKVVH